ncbi:yrdC domain-containing protein, mitochondrial isoform X2 [Brassica rapa]|uniref:yrdC domain-containing protein, mitochondrial isoform X2 n=1 Tax=Brassica campestris TaxID=3711 RepID=UPI0004F1CEC6|nr:yrdC domain-containing protein, mitochondrial isoform X2 [Brassica rapa]
MNFSTRLAEKLPGILPVPSHPLLRKGAIIPELRFFATASHSRRLRLGLQKNKVWSLQRAELCVVTSLCIVHPATEAYAQEAIEAIKSEKVIAVPTDTLYGFACDACSLEAVNRIYEIKGRKLTSPLAICVGDVLDIKRVATTNHLPHGLLDSLLPGPVTLVLQRVFSKQVSQAFSKSR